MLKFNAPICDGMYRMYFSSGRGLLAFKFFNTIRKENHVILHTNINTKIGGSMPAFIQNGLTEFNKI